MNPTKNVEGSPSNDASLLAELDELIKDLKVEDETLPADARGGQLIFPSPIATTPSTILRSPTLGSPTPVLGTPTVILRPTPIDPLSTNILLFDKGGDGGGGTVMCPW
jgi:hypothetical protein